MEKEILEKIVVTPQEKSEVVISGEVPFERLEKHRASAVKALGSEIEIDGFRKGHIPENILISKIGEMSVLTEMAERVLREVYPAVVAHHKLDVVGYPKISITKLAKNNPLGFSITVAVIPPVTLPDFKKIARGINESKESKEVTDEEVTKQIEDILRQKVAYERIQEKAKKNAGAPAPDHVHDENCDHEGHAHAHEQEDTPDQKNIKLPELTDEYVKGLGKEGQFTTVDDFKAKVREHITIEKARTIDSTHRARITDRIVEETTVELPQVMIDVEIDQMFAQMEDDLTRAQLKIDDYLGHIKKTKDDLRKEWVPLAEKRAKLQLVLNAIAHEENVTPDPSLVDHEVSNLLERYKDADESRVRIYVTSVLKNDAVMKMLEEVK